MYERILMAVGFKTGVPIMEETTEEANAVVSAAFEVLTQAGVKAYGEVRDIVLGYPGHHDA